MPDNSGRSGGIARSENPTVHAITGFHIPRFHCKLQPMAPPVVLSIAGFDPSSGAGITADIKTIAAHHCYGATCITALTVQSTAGVQDIRPLDGALVGRTRTIWPLTCRLRRSE